MSNPSEISVGSLEEEAYKRRERLRNLKRKFQDKEPTDTQTEAKPATETATEPESRVNGTEEPLPPAEDVVTIIESQLETLKEPLQIEEIDISNLAPRKPDWDLKRDVSKKLELLEKRTQRAIAEMIRERLKSNQGAIDLQAVNVLGGGYTTQSKQPHISN